MILLDTHVLVWLTAEPVKLSKQSEVTRRASYIDDRLFSPGAPIYGLMTVMPAAQERCFVACSRRNLAKG